MADIVVDTYKLGAYADRISAVNARLTRLDYRLDALYTKVGLIGLMKLLQADALTSYNWRLLRCQAYLTQTASSFSGVENALEKEDPLNFHETSIKEKLEKTIYDVGVAVKKGADKVSSVVMNAIDDTIASYYSHGWAYKVVQYGKAVIKGVKGVSKIVTGVGSLFGTGGLSAPVAILSIISGANDFYNAIMDVTYTAAEQYDQIGQNALKDLLTDNAGEIGEMLGDRELGEKMGTVLYYGVDVVTSLATLDMSMDKIKQLGSTNLTQMGSELKEIANLDVSHIFTTDLSTLRYEMKLAGYAFHETSNFVTNMGELINTGKAAMEFGENVKNLYAPES